MVINYSSLAILSESELPKPTNRNSTTSGRTRSNKASSKETYLQSHDVVILLDSSLLNGGRLYHHDAVCGIGRRSARGRSLPTNEHGTATGADAAARTATAERFLCSAHDDAAGAHFARFRLLLVAQLGRIWETWEEGSN